LSGPPPIRGAGARQQATEHEGRGEAGAHEQAQIHLDGEKDAENAHQLKITGDHADQPGRESREKEQSGRGSYRTLVHDGHVDTANPLANDGADAAIGSGLGHTRYYTPWGILDIWESAGRGGILVS